MPNIVQSIYIHKRLGRAVARLKKSRLRLVLSLFVAAVVFYTIFIGWVAATHAGKAYPRTLVAQQSVAGLTTQQAADVLTDALKSQQIKLTLNQQTITANLYELGFRVDTQQLLAQLNDVYVVKRLLPWWQSTQDIPLTSDVSVVEDTLKTLTQPNFVAPINAGFSLDDDNLVASTGKNGFGIDAQKLIEQITNLESSNLQSVDIQLTPQELTPTIQKADVEQLFPNITTKLGLNLQFTSDELAEPIVVSKATLASFLQIIKNNNTTQLSINQTAIDTYLTSLANQLAIQPVTEVTHSFVSGKASQIATPGVNGRALTNQHDLMQQLTEAIESEKDAKMALAFNIVSYEKITTEIDDTVIKASYTYSVEVWGSTSSDLATFKAHAAQTLADARGWAAAGLRFTEVASGGNFKLVLAEPARVDAASSGCDATYSCRVGTSVIINDARWSGATPSWNDAGGSLRDYQHMVINHEVGHWLGFGHANCPGAGQLAPVMQQQSISLQGCSFNPWPLMSEIDRV